MGGRDTNCDETPGMTIPMHSKVRSLEFVAGSLALLLFASCGSSTPEAAASEAGDKHCECEHLEEDLELKSESGSSSIADLVAAVEDVLERNDTLLVREAIELIRERHRADISDKERREDADQAEARIKQCRTEKKAMLLELKIKYPRKEDLEIMETVMDAKREICQEEREKLKNDFDEHFDKLDEERQQARMKRAEARAEAMLTAARAEAILAAAEAEAAVAAATAEANR